MTNKRDYIRHDAIHLIDYLVIDQDGRTGVYSMGRTLDVSEHGLQLETTNQLHPGARLQLTLGLANELVDLTGKVIHCRSSRGRYISGITFDPIDKESGRILDLYVEAFNIRQKQETAKEAQG